MDRSCSESILHGVWEERTAADVWGVGGSPLPVPGGCGSLATEGRLGLGVSSFVLLRKQHQGFFLSSRWTNWGVRALHTWDAPLSSPPEGFQALGFAAKVQGSMQLIKKWLLLGGMQTLWLPLSTVDSCQWIKTALYLEEHTEPVEMMIHSGIYRHTQKFSPNAQTYGLVISYCWEHKGSRRSDFNSRSVGAGGKLLWLEKCWEFVPSVAKYLKMIIIIIINYMKRSSSGEDFTWFNSRVVCWDLYLI